MIPNTYHWLQSVCLPLPPTEHLNSRTLWWVEGWKLVYLLHSTSPFFSSLHLFVFPYLQSKILFFALFHLLCHHLWSCSYLSVAFPASVFSFPHPPLLPILDPAGRVQPYIRLFLRGSERCACRPWWQKEQQSLTWTYAVRSPIYNSFS